jgi:hypothetical protein
MLLHSPIDSLEFRFYHNRVPRVDTFALPTPKSFTIISSDHMSRFALPLIHIMTFAYSSTLPHRRLGKTRTPAVPVP